MTIMYLFASVLAASAPQASSQSCDEAMTQQALNYCAALEFQKADCALNEEWEKVAERMKRLDAEMADAEMPIADDGRDGYYAVAVAAQRAWTEFRDAHCASEGYQARGGSLEPMLVGMCKADLTRKRTAQLRAMMEYPR